MTDKWKNIQGECSHKGFQDLFENKCAFIEINDFLTDDQCNKLVLALRKLGLYEYKYDFKTEEAPQAAHLFATHYLYENEPLKKYFVDAEKSYSDFDHMVKEIAFNPSKMVFDFLASKFEIPVNIAEEKGKKYFHSIARELNHSVLLHPDFAPFQALGRVISQIDSQYAWNLYLTNPKEGGETTVYNRPWNGAEDDAKFSTKTYGYNEKVVENCESASFPVSKGKLVFFNSRNFHKVSVTTKSRISLGGHIGWNKTTKKLLAWS